VEDRLQYSELLLSIARQRLNPKLAGAIAFHDRSSLLARSIKMLLRSRPAFRLASTYPFFYGSCGLMLVSALLIGSVRLNAARAERSIGEQPATMSFEIEYHYELFARISTTVGIMGIPVQNGGLIGCDVCVLPSCTIREADDDIDGLMPCQPQMKHGIILAQVALIAPSFAHPQQSRTRVLLWQLPSGINPDSSAKRAGLSLR
jgi:hypothetical protein